MTTHSGFPPINKATTLKLLNPNRVKLEEEEKQRLQDEAHRQTVETGVPTFSFVETTYDRLDRKHREENARGRRL